MAADLERIERMLRDGMPRHLICERVGKPMGTVDRYIGKVHARWRASSLARTEHAVEERLEHHRKMARLARSEGNWNACARYDREINLMLGVYAPEKHAIQAAVAHAVMPAQAAPAVNLLRVPDSGLDDLEALLRACQEQPEGSPQLPAHAEEVG